MNELLDIVRRDLRYHMTGMTGYSQDVVLIDTNDVNYNIKAYISNTTIHYDTGTGEFINSGRITCTVIESALQDASIVTRDSSNNLVIKGWKISFTNASGYVGTYVISELYPDNQLGNIVLILTK